MSIEINVSSSRARSTLTGVWSVLRVIVETPLLWQQRASERRTLAQLDDRILADIGLTRADIEDVVSRPFWAR